MPISIDRIQNKEIVIGILGLGYVGYPLSLVFAEKGFKVLGFDIDEEKIQHIEAGRSYFRHINSGRAERVAAAGTLLATTDFSRTRECDALVICVPTPLDSHLKPDLQYIEDTCRAIAPHIQPHTLVSLESTTYPGTTEEIVQPLLEEPGNVKAGRDLYLCFSPEREDPGNHDFGTQRIPKLVGAVDDNSLVLAQALYESAIDKVVPLSSPKVAEAAKLFENIFRSVNIALVNELKVLLDPMEIDVWEVVQAAATKPFGFMPFWPGPGLGGHCIPIDPFYLTWKVREYGLSTRFIELAGEINRGMPKWVVGKVQDCLNDRGKAVKGSRILILGLAYKPDIDDLRESPSRELMRLLEQKGAIVDYHDPLIPHIGPSRDYPDLEGKSTQDMSSDYDCFVLATHHSMFEADQLLDFGVPIVDTRNAMPKGDLVTPA